MKFYLAALFTYLAGDGIIELFWHFFLLLHSFHESVDLVLHNPAPVFSYFCCYRVVLCALSCWSSLLIAEVFCLEVAVKSCSGANHIVYSGIILLSRRFSSTLTYTRPHVKYDISCLLQWLHFYVWKECYWFKPSLILRIPSYNVF